VKSDVVEDMPAAPPRKRRQLEQVPDVWLAIWLDSEDLSPSDRRRCQDEKAERARRRKVAEHRVGLIVNQYGLTPDQLAKAIEALRGAGATEVHHGGVPSKLHNAARDLGVVHHKEPGWLYSEERDQEVIRSVDAVIACPKETTVQTYATPGVWKAIGYARHRGLPVTVISPTGDIL
jgi:hypothetical protein